MFYCDTMKILILNSYDELSKKAFEIFKDVIKNNPNSTIGFATGTTPIGLYKLIVEAYNNGEISFESVKTFNLDEYVGLGKDHIQSYAYFMYKHLFGNVNIKRENINLINGDCIDPNIECDRYNGLLDDSVIDLQILGLGSNGHIAFNEPGTSFESITHVVDLEESTIKDNARLFDDYDDVPRQAITMGIKNIMSAKKIMLLVSGKNKAYAIDEFLKGYIDEKLPCSILKRHEDLYVILDIEAASVILKKQSK